LLAPSRTTLKPPNVGCRIYNRDSQPAAAIDATAVASGVSAD
jgi:hypothetical protein